MNPNVLAGLLKRVYDNFDMIAFDNRLKIQKFVYLLQEYGLNLGYSFSLYLRGPYCTEVAKDGFQVENFGTIQQIKFDDEGNEAKFNRFLELYRPHKDEVDWLEVASSVLIFMNLYRTSDKGFVVEKVRNKNEAFSARREFIGSVWNELCEWGVINV